LPVSGASVNMTSLAPDSCAFTPQAGPGEKAGGVGVHPSEPLKMEAGEGGVPESMQISTQSSLPGMTIDDSDGSSMDHSFLSCDYSATMQRY